MPEYVRKEDQQLFFLFFFPGVNHRRKDETHFHHRDLCSIWQNITDIFALKNFVARRLIEHSVM